ncbi:MAG TPA: hypothetical protein VG367_20960 [Mucilaginibacter sp.]|jgi:hypothetical protein|nr:hypothetical protein [Mucilaginibacter sp.]
MIKYTRLFVSFLLVVIIAEARAQSTATTSSPYSRFGIGDFSNQLMPQNIGMGGISTATNIINNFRNVNVINPAANAYIDYTVIDAGIATDFLTLKQSGVIGSDKSSNLRLSHIAIGLPINEHSALAFGLMPYSQVGYNYKQTSKNFNTSLPSDTNAVNYIYSGEGGLSKAFLGYGVTLFRHLAIGANVSYIFGSLKQFQSTEIPNLYGVLDSRVEQDNHVGGFNLDYGAQYTFDFSTSQHLTLGYSASIGNKLNVQNSYIVSQYTYDSQGNQNNPADTLVNNQSPNGKLQLPRINHYGFAFRKDGYYLIGAEFTTGNWSDLSIAGTNAGLQNNKMFNIGASIVPNPNSLSNYLALVDYRIGFIYEDTYLNVNNVDIKRYAVTFGFGIPLPHDRVSSAFYKVNFSVEAGKRGTMQVVQENYVNLNLGFTLNDRWFQRFKFE